MVLLRQIFHALRDKKVLCFSASAPVRRRNHSQGSRWIPPSAKHDSESKVVTQSLMYSGFALRRSSVLSKVFRTTRPDMKFTTLCTHNWGFNEGPGIPQAIGQAVADSKQHYTQVQRKVASIYSSVILSKLTAKTNQNIQRPEIHLL